MQLSRTVTIHICHHSYSRIVRANIFVVMLFVRFTFGVGMFVIEILSACGSRLGIRWHGISVWYFFEHIVFIGIPIWHGIIQCDDVSDIASFISIPQISFPKRNFDFSACSGQYSRIQRIPVVKQNDKIMTFILQYSFIIIVKMGSTYGHHPKQPCLRIVFCRHMQHPQTICQVF